jgi:hypothetical protein
MESVVCVVVGFLILFKVIANRSSGSICFTPGTKVISTLTERLTGKLGSYEHLISRKILSNTVLQSRSTEFAGNYIWAGKVMKIRLVSHTGTVGTIVTV